MTSPSPNPTLEQEARSLREKLIGPMTDEEWIKCRENWMDPWQINWLRTEVKKMEGK